MKPVRRLRSRLSGYRAAEDGVISVESVIWMPIYFIFLSLIVDVSVMMHHKANALRIIQDGNRGASLGFYQSTDVAEEAILAQISVFSDEATVTTEKIGIDDEFYATSVSIPAHDLVLVGFFTTVFDITIDIVGYHLAEPCGTACGTT